MTVKWSANLATTAPTLTQGGAPVSPTLAWWPVGNPRMTVAGDVATFTVDAATLPAKAAGAGVISYPLSGVVVPPGADDALVKFSVRIHTTQRPEGSPTFVMTAPPIPTIKGAVWTDENVATTNEAKHPFLAQTYYVQKFSYGGPSTGWPEDFEMSWLATRAEAIEILSKPNPRIALLVTTSTGTVDLPGFAFTLSDAGVRILEGGGGAAQADVFYRDPADQKFKPLTTLMVNGFPCPPSGIDPATAKIEWKAHPLTVGAPVVSTYPSGFVPGAPEAPSGATTTAAAEGDGVRLTIVGPGGGSESHYGGALTAPLTNAPTIAADDRSVTIVATLTVHTWTVGNGINNNSLIVDLVSDGGSLRVYYGSDANNKTGPIVSALLDAKRAHDVLSGANLRVKVMASNSMLFGGVPPWNTDVAITGLAVRVQEVAAP